MCDGRTSVVYTVRPAYVTISKLRCLRRNILFLFTQRRLIPKAHLSNHTKSLHLAEKTTSPAHLKRKRNKNFNPSPYLPIHLPTSPYRTSSPNLVIPQTLLQSLPPFPCLFRMLLDLCFHTHPAPNYTLSVDS